MTLVDTESTLVHMTNTADLARKLPEQACYDLLRVCTVTDRASRRPVHPVLLTKALVNVNEGINEPTELGARVARHLDAGYQVQRRGQFLRIVERVLAAKTVDDDIEQAFRGRFTVAELDQFVAALNYVCAAARQASKD